MYIFVLGSFSKFILKLEIDNFLLLIIANNRIFLYWFL
jgi:hypothetical protein